MSATGRRWRLFEEHWSRLVASHDVSALRRFALRRVERRPVPTRLVPRSCARVVVCAAHRAAGVTKLCECWTVGSQLASLTHRSLAREVSLRSAYVGRRGDFSTARVTIIDQRYSARAPLLSVSATPTPTAVVALVDLTRANPWDAVANLVAQGRSLLRPLLAADLPVVLVGTKAQSPQRVVSRREASAFANRHGLVFIETDAATGYGTETALLYTCCVVHLRPTTRPILCDLAAFLPSKKARGDGCQS